VQVRIIIEIFFSLVKNFFIHPRCAIFLDEPFPVAEVLEKLSKGGLAEVLMSYQIAYVRVGNASVLVQVRVHYIVMLFSVM
jgi:hypothetical protein